jgi:hypothetical protein
MIKKGIIVLMLTVFAISCSKDDAVPHNPTLTIQVDGQNKGMFNLSQLKANLTAQSISIFDPVHGKQKNYRAFPLADALFYLFESNFLPTNGTVQFSALDGFMASASVNRATEIGGFLAFEDLDVAGEANWEGVAPENNNDPAPFYIVWSGQNQNPTTDGYPWPYQLETINLVN